MTGAQLRAARKARGLTQAELAEAVGTGQTYISALESGAQTNVTIDLLQRIAAALDMTVTITLTEHPMESAAPTAA